MGMVRRGLAGRSAALEDGGWERERQQQMGMEMELQNQRETLGEGQRESSGQQVGQPGDGKELGIEN